MERKLEQFQEKCISVFDRNCVKTKGESVFAIRRKRKAPRRARLVRSTPTVERLTLQASGGLVVAKSVDGPQPGIEPEGKMSIFPRCKCRCKANPRDFAKLVLRPLLCRCLRSYSEFQADNDIPDDTASPESAHACTRRNFHAESQLFLLADPDRPHRFHGGFRNTGHLAGLDDQSKSRQARRRRYQQRKMLDAKGLLHQLLGSPELCL